jgi:hypothetical protein
VGGSAAVKMGEPVLGSGINIVIPLSDRTVHER